MQFRPSSSSLATRQLSAFPCAPCSAIQERGCQHGTQSRTLPVPTDITPLPSSYGIMQGIPARLPVPMLPKTQHGGTVVQDRPGLQPSHPDGRLVLPMWAQLTTYPRLLSACPVLVITPCTRNLGISCMLQTGLGHWSRGRATAGPKAAYVLQNHTRSNHHSVTNPRGH